MVCALYCIENLVSLLSFFLILNIIFKEQPRTEKWRPVLCAAISIAASVSGFILLPSKSDYAFELLDFIATVIALISIPLLFRQPRFWRGFAVLFLYYATIDTLWSFLATFFEAGILQESIFNFIVTSAVCITVYKCSDHKDLNIMAGAFHEIPVWLLISLFLFELTNYYKEFGVSETWYNFLYVTSSCLVFLSILYLVFRVFRLVYTQNDILQKLNAQLVYETQREQSDESLRRFRHDFKNHSIVVNAMLEQGDTDGAKRYFSGISSDISQTLPMFSTGNSIVNSLLHIKSADAAAHDTEIHFDGMIPAVGIEPKDMCICVGNLLDNAIEACATLPETEKKTISVSAVIRNNMFLLTVQNPTDPGKRIMKNQTPATTKSDKRAHGIGLRNVRDVAKKYHGTLQLSAENGVFTAELFVELQE